MLQILASSSCLQVSTRERYSRGENIYFQKSSSWRMESKRKCKFERKAAEGWFWASLPIPDLSVGLLFLMPGGSELPSHDS
jgi:hypothetical protein